MAPPGTPTGTATQPAVTFTATFTGQLNSTLQPDQVSWCCLSEVLAFIVSIERV